MSTEQNKKNRRYIGKFRATNSQYGTLYKIYADNTNHLNQDGSPNPYYNGALIWADKNGNNYHVKQMSLWVPKEGMPQSAQEKGYTHYVTLNLDDKYEVTVLAN